MTAVLAVAGRVAADVWSTFASVWPFLLLSVVIAAALNTYVGADRLGGWLRRRTGVAVAAAVLLATLTPFCSCGTTAVVLGALATRVPWAPLVAFMVASPLTSPHEYVLSTGFFGLPFATTFFVAAIVLGLAAGAVTHLIEQTGWLANQARMRDTTPATVTAGAEGCCVSSASAGGDGTTATSGGGGTATLTLLDITTPPQTGLRTRWKLDQYARELATTGRRLALFFFGFAAIGYLLIETIPTAWLTGYLGGGTPWAVLLAALLGIPVYLNTDGSLPLVAALMNGGMGPGPALAFLVTGAGTSIGAITGMLVIARARVVALVIGLLFTGAVILGWAAPLWL